MTERIVTDSNGRKYITNEPNLHQKQSTWVGLTVDEMVELVQKYRDTPVALVDTTEAKLKAKNERLEKNT